MTKLRSKKTTNLSAFVSSGHLSVDSSFETSKTSLHSNEHSFLFTLRPVIHFSRLFGLISYSIVQEPNGEIREPKVTKCGAFWFVSSMALCLSMAYINHINSPSLSNSVSFILHMGLHLLVFFEMIFGVIVLLFDMCNRFKTVAILKTFTNFDTEMICISSTQMVDTTFQFDYKKSNRFNWICCICLSIATITILGVPSIVFFFDESHDISFLNILHFYSRILFGTSVSTVPLLLYIVLLRNLRQRFQMINTLLRNRFLIGKTLKMAVNIRKAESIAAIKYVGRQHSFLTSIMERINACYAYQIMLNATVTLVFSVLAFYTFYRYIFQQNVWFMEMAWIHLIWESIFLTCTMSAIYHATQVTAEGQNTTRISHDIINLCNDPDITVTLGQLCLQTQCRFPIATCGLFTFDWTLLFAIGATTASYLCIILNFELPQSTK